MNAKPARFGVFCYLKPLRHRATKRRNDVFEYIKGQLEAQSADTVVIENNGIGYRVCVS